MTISKTTVYAFEPFSLHHTVLHLMYVAVHTMHMCIRPSWVRVRSAVLYEYIASQLIDLEWRDTHPIPA
jgi:hypothetical protein